MSSPDLRAKILAAKTMLQKEIIRNRINPGDTLLSYREIDARLGLLHEAERVGLRNLGENQNRKLVKMIEEVERLVGKPSMN
jgi:uncharacterized protein YqgV (UPF0045/DUF77 family)